MNDGIPPLFLQLMPNDPLMGGGYRPLTSGNLLSMGGPQHGGPLGGQPSFLNAGGSLWAGFNPGNPPPPDGPTMQGPGGGVWGAPPAPQQQGGWGAPGQGPVGGKSMADIQREQAEEAARQAAAAEQQAAQQAAQQQAQQQQQQAAAEGPAPGTSPSVKGMEGLHPRVQQLFAAAQSARTAQQAAQAQQQAAAAPQQQQAEAGKAGKGGKKGRDAEPELPSEFEVAAPPVEAPSQPSQPKVAPWAAATTKGEGMMRNVCRSCILAAGHLGGYTEHACAGFKRAGWVEVAAWLCARGRLGLCS